MSQKTVQLNKREFLLVVCMSSALGAGAVGGGVFVYEQNDATEQIQPHRYPLKNEITIVRHCFDRSGVSLSSHEARLRENSRWNSCVCALQNNQKKYSWSAYQIKYDQFWAELKTQYWQCNRAG